jgi:hypothetical protein
MSNALVTTPKFPLGQTVITTNANTVLPELDVIVALQRHQSGDWGNVDNHDRQMNQDALRTGGRLFSVYHTTGGTKFWIITEWDRSVTTVLLPDDY